MLLKIISLISDRRQYYVSDIENDQCLEIARGINLILARLFNIVDK